MRSSSQSNRYSRRDVHEIDQTQFDDSVQFEQDSITTEFNNVTQLRYSNIMFDEVSSAPSLQRVLTDVQVTAMGVSQSNWLKHHFKVDNGACENLMPVIMFKSLYSKTPSANTINSTVCLCDYNKQETKQLGTCKVLARLKSTSTSKPIHFYVVHDRLKHIIGVSDTLALGLISLSHIQQLA